MEEYLWWICCTRLVNLHQRHMQQDAACHSQMITTPPAGVIHPPAAPAEETLLWMPTLQWLSSHPSVSTLNHKEKSVPWSRGMAQAGGCFCQPCPGAVPAALSRTAPANISSCLRHQRSKVSQGKIHPGLANPIPPPGHACLRLCAFTPVSYGVWPRTWQFLCLGWPL